MSNTYGSGSGPVSPNPDSLNLGPSPWVPTQPASQYLPISEPGYSPVDSQQAPTGWEAPRLSANGQSQPDPYGHLVDTSAVQPAAGDAGYQVYNPQATMTPNMQPYNGGQPYPPIYPAQPGMMVPGQVVQTSYGTFMVGDKSKLAAGLLGIFLGGFGAGQFYRGNAGMGVVQIVVTFFTLGLGSLWGLIEGIVVLASQPGSPSSLDSNGQIMA